MDSYVCAQYSEPMRVPILFMISGEVRLRKVELR